VEELGPVFDKVARYFSLLSDASRLKVIHSICHVEQSVNEVVAATGLSQSTVSRHLANLHLSGVASRRKAGAQARYAITDRTLTEICRSACVSLVSRELDTREGAALHQGAARFMRDAAPEPTLNLAAPTYAAFAAGREGHNAP